MPGVVSDLASYVAAPEDVFRLMLSLLAGFPLAVIYKMVFYGRPPASQHLYFTLCGLSIGYFNFGVHVMHSLTNTVLVYILLIVLGGTALSVVLAFILNMGYLYVGYYYNMRDFYMIDWTMAHCVLMLRLTGLAFDLYDGKQKKEDLSADQLTSALDTRPSLLEMCGHVFFFGGFMVGPQFPMRKYLDFVHNRGVYSDPVLKELNKCIAPAVRRLVPGILYTVAHQAGAMLIPETYAETQDFKDLGLWRQCAVLIVLSRTNLFKYVTCWLVTESACIVSGLAYKGKDKDGRYLWDGCSNVDIWKFETTGLCVTFVDAFNINTNRWSAKYVYKRFKFLGNRKISQLITLVFLALWHGFYSGYLVAFLLEFTSVNCDRLIGPILASTWVVKTVRGLPAGPQLIFVLQKLWGHLVVGYAFVAFSTKTFWKYFDVYVSMYFFIHVITIGVPILLTVFNLLRKPKERSKQE